MRVFVYEHLCAGGLAGQAGAEALRAEGWAMLAAVAADFGRLAGVQTLTLLDASWGRGLPGTTCRRARAGGREDAFAELAARADGTLVIAPESDGALLALCRRVEEVGGRLLGPSPAAVRRAGDKWELNKHLRDRGVPTPGCVRYRAGRAVPAALLPAVLKPRDGAGSQATFLVPAPDALADCLRQGYAARPGAEFLLQRHVPGKAASVAFLVGPRSCLPLPPAAQHLSADGRFRYLGGRVPLQGGLAGRAARLGRRAVAAVEGLCGFVGVDLVLGAAPDGSQDWVIEVNPRLTTSYVGLRRLTAANLMQALLQVVRGQATPGPPWNPGEVRFWPDGRTE